MIVTHSGRFHADEVFALAMLKRLDNRPVVRSRDPEVIRQADLVLDVGAEYDPDRGRFDHHQNSFTLTREDSTPYATAGLIWLHFGEAILKKTELETQDQRIYARDWVDQKLIKDIDAVDNGVFADSPRPSISMVIGMMNASSSDDEVLQTAAFEKAVAMADDILNNFIAAAVKEAVALPALLNALAQLDEGVMVLDEALPFKDFIRHYPQIRRVVYPKGEEGYGVYCNQAENHLPERFRGLRGDSLVAVSGFEDAIFCHKTGFMCVMGNFDSAMAMAKS
ncbi:MYG1 family protein [Thiomicrospira sp. WB1]|uniref:MYG1 family protein n=1 Tax=Thiomicrospira sp. WB1 TaxID=1685380 RepID=UPI00074AE61B|nr:MYG1 family protein [Thiomicrospira sp. WB1]KUJ71855.1 metal-dependent hydrolase [Thiomicrospira sp. WB1]